MIAHVSPYYILGFWALLLVAMFCGFSAIALVFLRRTGAARGIGIATILLGLLVGWISIEDGALRHLNWFTVVSALPLLLGAIALTLPRR